MKMYQWAIPSVGKGSDQVMAHTMSLKMKFSSPSGG